MMLGQIIIVCDRARCFSINFQIVPHLLPNQFGNNVPYHEKNILTEAVRQYPSTRRLAAVLKTSQSTIVRRFRKHGLTHLLKQISRT